MNIYIVKWDYSNGLDYEDFRILTEYWYYSTQELAEKAYYAHIYGAYKGRYTLIEKTLDTQEDCIIERSPWSDELEDMEYHTEDYEQSYDWEDPFQNYDMAYYLLTRKKEEDNHVPSADDIWEEYEIESLNKSLTKQHLDSLAKEYCGCLSATEDTQERREINRTFDAVFKQLGYAKAWKQYKDELFMCNLK